MPRQVEAKVEARAVIMSLTTDPIIGLTIGLTMSLMLGLITGLIRRFTGKQEGQRLRTGESIKDSISPTSFTILSLSGRKENSTRNGFNAEKIAFMTLIWYSLFK